LREKINPQLLSNVPEWEKVDLNLAWEIISSSIIEVANQSLPKKKIYNTLANKKKK
ncbi:11294_t:CDS:1, partial [Dentiscutata heterogama]